MALATLGETLKGEVISRNESKGSVTLELDTGERALLPGGNMLGKSWSDRQERFEALTDGNEIQVIVVAERQDRNFKSWFIVSERLDDAIETDQSEGSEAVKPTFSGGALDELVSRYPAGKRITGVVQGRRADAIAVRVGNVVALLPIGEIGTAKSTSFQNGVNVKATVLAVGAQGLVLTRKA